MMEKEGNKKEEGEFSVAAQGLADNFGRLIGICEETEVEFWAVGFVGVRGIISVMQEGSEIAVIIVGYFGFKEREWANGYLGFPMENKDLGLIFENDDDIISDISLLWAFVWFLNSTLRVAQAILNQETSMILAHPKTFTLHF